MFLSVLIVGHYWRYFSLRWICDCGYSISFCFKKSIININDDNNRQIILGLQLHKQANSSGSLNQDAAITSSEPIQKKAHLIVIS